MRRPGLFTIAAFSAAASLLACNQPFDPRLSHQDHLVVFSILSTDHAAQFVRVESTYMPPDFDPVAYTADKFVVNAVVILKEDSVSYRLHDTALVRQDTNRYKFPLRAYVLSPFTPKYGKLYQISVESAQFGTASGSAVVPTKTILGMSTSAAPVLDDPGGHDNGATIPCGGSLSDVTMGYLGRLFIDYSVLKGDSWDDGRIEVPLKYRYFNIHDFKDVEYPEITRRPTTYYVSVLYTNELYKAALMQVAYAMHPASKLVFNRIVFRFVQMEQNLYDYYEVAHSFNDPHSTRLDEPLYSNVAGSVGLVGAYTLDSAVHPLPQNFSYNRR